MNQLENIRRNAELVVETFAENNSVELDFDEESVEWIDGYIEKNRADWSPETAERLSVVLGSFLGECICRNYGGEWRETEHGFGVAFDGGNAAYPFNKVAKQIKNGSEDSIASFYNSISLLFNR